MENHSFNNLNIKFMCVCVFFLVTDNLVEHLRQIFKMAFRELGFFLVLCYSSTITGVEDCNNG